MRRRLLEALAVASVMIALIMFLRLSVAGQAAVPQSTARTPAPRVAVSKTAWGHPSIEGIWLDEFDTPLERPAKYATREFFTADERAAQDKERTDNAGREDQSMADRCMAGSEPDFIGFRRIVQGPDSIAIGVDTGQGQGFQRVVYLSGNHPPSSLRLRHGDSRGHFEGNSLVVETTN